MGFLIYTDRIPENVCGILRVWNNDKGNIKSDQAKLTDMGSLRRDSAFVLLLRVRKVSTSLCSRVLETWKQRWSTTSKSEMLDLSCSDVEEEIQKFKDIGMLEGCYFRPVNPLWEGLEDAFYHCSEEHNLSGSPYNIEELYNNFSWPDLTVGAAIGELGNLNAITVIGSPGSRGQVTALYG